jgi:aryl-alcohol dehydrogenase-like predicted oxidoreductase
MHTRALGPFTVTAIGLGCMSLSHAYGTPPPEKDCQDVLLKALDLGYTFFDTAAIYGMGRNETLVGKTILKRRSEFTLASKGGMGPVNGQRAVSSKPADIKRDCEDSLRRLGTDVIDLYYLHRWDKRTPIEEAVGAMADLKAEGKIREIGLSEVSGSTLRRAHKAHPIAAVQNEYSLWSRNPEISLIEACRDLGVKLVAFGSVGRGFFGGALTSMDGLPASDIRVTMPRFMGENFQANLKLLDGLKDVARDAGATPAQLALAWTLARGEDVISIPGTTRLDHLAENAAAADLKLDAETAKRLEAVFAPAHVHGARYAPAAQAGVDTEEFAAASAR